MAYSIPLFHRALGPSSILRRISRSGTASRALAVSVDLRTLCIAACRKDFVYGLSLFADEAPSPKAFVAVCTVATLLVLMRLSIRLNSLAS